MSLLLFLLSFLFLLNSKRVHQQLVSDARILNLKLWVLNWLSRFRVVLGAKAPDRVSFVVKDDCFLEDFIPNVDVSLGQVSCDALDLLDL